MLPFRLLSPLSVPSRVLLSCLVLLFVWAGPATARDLVERRVRALLAPHLPTNAVIKVLPMAGRLPPCEDPQAFLSHSGQRLLGRVSVGIRCAGTPPQTRYVQASISVRGEYLVARRTIQSGELVTPEMLELRQGLLERLPRGILTSMEQAIGLQAGRTLATGSMLRGNALHRPKLVERNARVTLEARGPGFVIRREAIALEGGGMDGEIRVRSGSGEVLRGRVVGLNRLQVGY